MTDDDKPEFAELIIGAYQIYGREIGKAGLKQWYEQLKRFPLPVVTDAITRYHATKQAFGVPTPARVLALLRNPVAGSEPEPARTAHLNRADPEKAREIVAEVLSLLRRGPKTRTEEQAAAEQRHGEAIRGDLSNADTVSAASVSPTRRSTDVPQSDQAEPPQTPGRETP